MLPEGAPDSFFFISPFRQRHGIAILEVFFDITVTEVAISSFGEQLTSLFFFLLLFFVENFWSGVKITGQETSSYFFPHEVAPMESLPLFPPFTMGLKKTVAYETRYARSFFPQFAFIFCEALFFASSFFDAASLMFPPKKEIQNAFRHNVRLVWEIAVCVFSRKTRLVFLATGLGKVSTQVARYEILCEDDIVYTRKKLLFKFCGDKTHHFPQEKKEQKR